MALRPWPFVAAATAFAAFVTLAVATIPAIEFAYRSESLHVALDVTAGLISTFAAYLVYGRFRSSRRLDDLALVCGLAVTAGANLFFAALPSALPSLEAGTFGTWSAVGGRLLGAALLAFAAFAPRPLLLHPLADARAALLGCVAALTGIGLLVLAFEDRLPAGINPTVSPGAAREPLLVGHEAVHAAQLVALVFFVVAAIGFTRRATRDANELDRWFGAACVLAAFARLHYFLFPSLYSEWVYTGDFFRLGFYLLLLVGIARELSVAQRRAAEATVLEERRRLARDLHDGLAQEVGFIVMHARSHLPTAPSVLEPIAVAAERAVDEARRAIGALTRDVDEPLDVAVAQAAEDVAHRTGTRVELELQPDVRVQPAVREELLRIVREAVTNAARHANASVVRVELGNGSENVRLRIRDDGTGFDPSTRRAGGYGVTGMHERAKALGAQLKIASSSADGTEVEIVLPTKP